MVRLLPLVGALVLLAPGVRAEPGGAEARAYEAFERGRRFFDAEDFLAAARAFEEAYEIRPSAAVHYNIARSYELAELPDLAAEHYRAFLDGRAGSPARRRQVQATLDRLLERVGFVLVSSEPAGAAISVGGRLRGRAPATIALSAGTHVVEAELEGETGSARVRVEPGVTVEASVALAGSASEAARGPAVEPGRGHGSGQVADEPAAASPGSSERTRRGPGRIHHGWFWTSLTLALASGGALAGVGTHMLALASDYDALAARTDLSAEEAERRDLLLTAGPSWEAATTGLWISTGVLVGLSVVLAIVTDWSTLRRSPPGPSGALAPGWTPVVVLAGAGASD